MLEKEIIKNDYKEECVNLVAKAQEYSKSIEEQLEFVEKAKFNSETKLNSKLILLQLYYAVLICEPEKKCNKVEISMQNIEYLLRSMLDMARHMQQNLPDGVYQYIEKNMDNFIKTIV